MCLEYSDMQSESTGKPASTRRGRAVRGYGVLRISSDCCHQLSTVIAIACPATSQAVGQAEVAAPFGKARARPFPSGAQGRRARVSSQITHQVVACVTR